MEHIKQWDNQSYDAHPTCYTMRSNTESWNEKVRTYQERNVVVFVIPQDRLFEDEEVNLYKLILRRVELPDGSQPQHAESSTQNDAKAVE